MKLLITGSHSINDPDVTTKIVKSAIAFYHWMPREIVCGESTTGPDQHATIFATVSSIPLVSLHSDVAKYADAGVIIWDGVSEGTKEMIKQMDAEHKHYHLCIYYEPKYDGQTHINIYSKGRTELGRLLSNFTKTPFTHPAYGEFNSIEGYWYWLSTGKQHDELRHLDGIAAKHAGRKFKRILYNRFEQDVIEGLQCKLDQHPKIKQLLKESSLPLTHYYFYGEVDRPFVVDNSNVRWIVDWFEGYRKGLKENGQP